MDDSKTDRINRRAYELWEAEGRPHGRHDEHWLAAEREFSEDESQDGPRVTDPHPGMMGDGTEEQNLGQPGHPEARISEDEVREAFSGGGESENEDVEAQ